MYTYILKGNLLQWFTDGGPARPTMPFIPWGKTKTPVFVQSENLDVRAVPVWSWSPQR